MSEKAKKSIIQSLNASMATLEKSFLKKEMEMAINTNMEFTRIFSQFETYLQNFISQNQTNGLPSDFLFRLTDLYKQVIDLLQIIDEIFLFKKTLNQLDKNMLNYVINNVKIHSAKIYKEIIENYNSSNIDKRNSDNIEFDIDIDEEDNEIVIVRLRKIKINENENDIEVDDSIQRVDSGYASMSKLDFNPDSEIFLKNQMEKYMSTCSKISELDFCDDDIYENVEFMTETEDDSNDILKSLDISKYLVIEKNNEDKVTIKAGYKDALIVQATFIHNPEYGETFILTYRAFVSTKDLLEKLIIRYNEFLTKLKTHSKNDANDVNNRTLRETFSLMTRIISSLILPEVKDEPEILRIVANFSYDLIRNGLIIQADVLRQILFQRILIFYKKQLEEQNTMSNGYPIQNLTLRKLNIFDEKPNEIANQLTLIDQDFYQKIESPELILYVENESFKLSPNLAKFVEHFNNISRKVQTKLLQEPCQTRKKLISFYFNIVRHLKRINNFSSYFAILSGFTATPIQRLHLFDQEKDYSEYFEILNPEKNFKNYRSAIEKINGPCIPHIAIIIGDLFFAKLNALYYDSQEIVNFSKYWIVSVLIKDFLKYKNETYYHEAREDMILSICANLNDNLDSTQIWDLSNEIYNKINL